MPTHPKQDEKPSAKASHDRSPARKSAPAKKASRNAPETGDAIALLTRDHRDVTKLFKAYEKLAGEGSHGDERLEVSRRICEMLTAHTTIEEEIFYPAMREALDADDLLDEAAVEHASAKDLIAQIESMDPDDDLYDAKVIVLGEYVQHHVKEEESELFPKAAKAKLDLGQLARDLAARKAELIGDPVEEDA
jgi:hemerythrin superfamily protein